jgi:hypothetical protein
MVHSTATMSPYSFDPITGRYTALPSYAPSQSNTPAPASPSPAFSAFASKGSSPATSGSISPSSSTSTGGGRRLIRTRLDPASIPLAAGVGAFIDGLVGDLFTVVVFVAVLFVRDAPS